MNVIERAIACFLCKDPDEKMALTQETVRLWNEGALLVDHPRELSLFDFPGKAERPLVVLPKDVKKRKLNTTQGQACMLHALAHIEWTAVNLAWDTIIRFHPMPGEFLEDWIRTAEDEARHFIGLRDLIRDRGFDYGDFPVHDQLWQMALKTKESVVDRMGIVHRVLEARALDVVPGIAKKFEELGQSGVVSVLHAIANDEVRHVSASTRWFNYGCQVEQKEPEETFFQLLRKYMQSPLRGPFNHEARLQAGFSINELNRLEEGTLYLND